MTQVSPEMSFSLVFIINKDIFAPSGSIFLSLLSYYCKLLYCCNISFAGFFSYDRQSSTVSGVVLARFHGVFVEHGEVAGY